MRGCGAFLFGYLPLCGLVLVFLVCFVVGLLLGLV